MRLVRWFRQLPTDSLNIPADYKGKMIHVRAYTKWMLNFDSAFIYNKTIPILTKEAGPANQKNAVIPSIQFFPEGGDIIAGLSNKIAFKANDQWGRPVKVKGVIVNSKSKAEDSICTSMMAWDISTWYSAARRHLFSKMER